MIRAPAPVREPQFREMSPLVPRRRPFPTSPFELSILTLQLGPVRGPADIGPLRAAVRRARASGITTFDLTEGPEPGVAESVLRAAFPPGDAEVVVILPAGPAAPRAATVPGLETAPSRLPGAGRPEEAGTFPRLYEVSSRAAPGLPGREPAVPPTHRVIRCRSAEEAEAIAGVPGPLLAAGPLSLLQHDLPTTVAAGRDPTSFAWIARDPFAGGRLDGSRFAVPRFAGGPVPAPATVRQLGSELESVLPFAFLARPGQRTLAQAAIRFPLAHRYVASVVIPVPAPERWEEIVGFEASAALSEDEVARAARATQAAPAEPAEAPGDAP